MKEYYVLFDNATEEKDYLHLLFFQLSVIMIFAEQLFFNWVWQSSQIPKTDNVLEVYIKTLVFNMYIVH